MNNIYNVSNDIVYRVCPITKLEALPTYKSEKLQVAFVRQRVDGLNQDLCSNPGLDTFFNLLALYLVNNLYNKNNKKNPCN